MYNHALQTIHGTVRKSQSHLQPQDISQDNCKTRKTLSNAINWKDFNVSGTAWDIKHYRAYESSHS